MKNYTPEQRKNLFFEYIHRGYSRRRSLYLAGYRAKSKKAADVMAHRLIKARKTAQDSLTHAGVPAAHSEGPINDSSEKGQNSALQTKALTDTRCHSCGMPSPYPCSCPAVIEPVKKPEPVWAPLPPDPRYTPMVDDPFGRSKEQILASQAVWQAYDQDQAYSRQAAAESERRAADQALRRQVDRQASIRHLPKGRH